MKTRIGFVSNSSSSSFVVAVKGTTLHKAFKEMEEKEMKKGGLFSDFIKTALDVLEHNADELTEERVKDDFGVDSVDEYITEGYQYSKDIKRLIKEGFTIYIGELSDEGGDGPEEAMLCNTDLNYESKNLVILHEGGY
jgi:hypothetical protein